MSPSRDSSSGCPGWARCLSQRFNRLHQQRLTPSSPLCMPVTTASAATRLTARHTHFSDRARTTLLPCAAPDAYLHWTWKETWRLLATALPPNSAGSAIVADQGQGVCLERRPFPLAPSPPTLLRRSSLAAAAKRPLAVSVGSAQPNSQRLQLVSRTAVRLVTGEPRGGDVLKSRLS